LSDERDGIPLVPEQIGEHGAFDFVSFVLKPVDFDAELNHGLFCVQRLDSLRQKNTTNGHLFGQQNHSGRNRIQTVCHYPECHVINSVEDVVELGSEGLDVFGIEGRNKSGSQTAEDIVDDLIPFIFNPGHFRLNPANSLIAAAQSGDEKLRCSTQYLGVALEKFEKLLILR
jgi:hypothetical protein